VEEARKSQRTVEEASIQLETLGKEKKVEPFLAMI